MTLPGPVESFQSEKGPGCIQESQDDPSKGQHRMYCGLVCVVHAIIVIRLATPSHQEKLNASLPGS